MADINNRWLKDNTGEYFFPITHIDNVNKIENILKDSTDWVNFTPLTGTPNTEFKATGENGFNCSYKTVDLLGILRMKTIRINMSNVKHGDLLYKFPSDFVTQSHSWLVRVPRNRMPATLSLRPNGELTLALNTADDGTWSAADYIYGEFTWIE